MPASRDGVRLTARPPAAAVVLLLLAGCSGARSALDPAGPEAEAVARLFVAMAVAGALIWLAVIGGFLYAGRRRRVWSRRAAGRLILLGGVVTPSVALLGLLAYALWLMPQVRPWAAETRPDVRVDVTGRQFWWDVRYRSGGVEAVRTANEIRMPVGERVEFTLRSDDVIHSFWIPPLGGKMDMIPGRTNTLTLQADRAGSYRGACAEYCGTSHALMTLNVEAMARPDFEAWLAAEAAPAADSGGAGLDIFLANGCGACHAVRGTVADGRVGPDLSHLGSRAEIGAGAAPRSPDAIARFVADPDAVKPGARMPGFSMLSEDDLTALSLWLDGLR